MNPIPVVVVRHYNDISSEDYGLCGGTITTVPTFSFWPGKIQPQISTKTAGTLVIFPYCRRLDFKGPMFGPWQSEHFEGACL